MMVRTHALPAMAQIQEYDNNFKPISSGIYRTGMMELLQRPESSAGRAIRVIQDSSDGRLYVGPFAPAQGYTQIYHSMEDAGLGVVVREGGSYLRQQVYLEGPKDAPLRQVEFLLGPLEPVVTPSQDWFGSACIAATPTVSEEISTDYVYQTALRELISVELGATTLDAESKRSLEEIIKAHIKNLTSNGPVSLRGYLRNVAFVLGRIRDHDRNDFIQDMAGEAYNQAMTLGLSAHDKFWMKILTHPGLTLEELHSFIATEMIDGSGDKSSLDPILIAIRDNLRFLEPNAVANFQSHYGIV